MAIKERNSSFELMRLFAMSCVVIHHFFVHGLCIYESSQGAVPLLTSSKDFNLVALIDGFFAGGVNLFILISGYFSLKLKANGLIKLFLICSFYGFIIYLSIMIINGTFELSYWCRLISRSIFVFSRTPWWYMRTYFILLLLVSPINKYIEVASKKDLQFVLFCLAIVVFWIGWFNGLETSLVGGNNIINFIFLYLIGRYIRLYGIKKYKNRTYIFIYAICSLFMGLLTIYLNETGNNIYKASYLNDPFIIIRNICVLMIFSSLSFKSKIINYMAASCLPIYLFQDGGISFYSNISKIYVDFGLGFSFFLLLFLYYVISMVGPILVDKLRVYLFGGIENYLSNKFSNLNIIKKIIPE